jgi:hypothetical protein
MKLPKFNIQYLILFSFLFCTSLKSFAQSEPTIEETAEWIRSKLITHGFGNNVKIDVSNCTISYYYGGEHTILISNLNANAIKWNDNNMLIPGAQNKPGQIVEHKDHTSSEDSAYIKFNDMDKDNMKERFTKAMKLLIKQCGGYTKEEKF